MGDEQSIPFWIGEFQLWGSQRDSGWDTGGNSCRKLSEFARRDN